MVRVRVLETAHDGGRVLQFSHTRTHLGWPMYWASSYWVDGLLIDAGPSHTGPAFEARLGSRPVEAIVLTHHHEDHVGNVARIQAAWETPAFASTWSAHRAQTRGPLPDYRRHVWGEPAPGRLEALPSRLTTPRHEFEVLPTPGHTPGDVALLEPREGWAFVGDLFLAPRHVITRPQEDLAGTLRSLERVLAREPRLLFTGRRVYSHASQVLLDRLVFLRQVLHDLNVLRKQGFTRLQARRRLLGREGWLHYWSRGDFAKQHFVDQAYACLDPAHSPEIATTGPAH